MVDHLYLLIRRGSEAQLSLEQKLDVLISAKASLIATHGVEQMFVGDDLAVVRLITSQSISAPDNNSLTTTDRSVDVWRRLPNGAMHLIASIQYPLRRLP